PREIVSRVQALLRRSQSEWAPSSDQPGSPVTIREQSLVISLFEKELTVSPREVLLLRLLTARPNTIVPEEELIGALWNRSPFLHEQELLRVIRGLRRKLENNAAGSIEMLPGIGYRFVQHPL
ncbi:MAG TPA: winged helix-turn-helix domain-containing protein, partial [Nitrospira sp.]|nr:winged helix-turn-helix domain-containing protein [Nitrospira sp.]